MSTFRARRTPRQPGPAAWNRLLAEASPPVVLNEDITADVVIVGAGFAGLSAARRLMQLDEILRIAVLEAGRVAEGPAGRNSGFMIDLPHDLASENYGGDAAEHDRLETDLNRRAIDFAADAAAEYDMPREYFDPCGKINAAATPAGDTHNKDYGALLSRMNEPFEMIDADGMREITGIEHYTSGLFTPGAVMLQPAGYIRSLAAGIGRRVAVYENSPVVEIARSGENWRVSTKAGVVTAPRVILANNGHAESFGFFRRRLMHVFTYASMTAAIPDGVLGGEPKWGVTPADPMGTSVRRISGTGGNRIVIRTRFTYNPDMEVSDAALANAGAVHDRKFRERFGALDGIEMEYRWAGHLCLSRNNVPAHGEVEEGIFAAVCQNGLGTAKGTLAGMSAAELALGQQSDISHAMTGMDAPDQLPPEPFAWIGANAYMRWKEWRAGRE